MNISTTLHNTRLNSKLLTKVGIIFFLSLILIYPTSSYYGAKKGLLLWFNTILPTLLPFIIVSNLIIKLHITNHLSKILYPFFHFLFGVSKGGCYPVLIGLLSGIPVGAKSVSDLVANSSIQAKEGQYLLGFCNNASPMFIMSYIAISQLKQENIRIPLIIIIYLSGILGSIIYFRIIEPLVNRLKKDMVHTQSIEKSMFNDIECSNNDSTKLDFALLDSSIMDGFEVITKVGGYVILFSIPAEIITSIVQSDNILKLISIGLIEITTGINQISLSGFSLDIKIVLITLITTFGGLSGVAQTKSVISNSRLSIGTYITVKIFNSLISGILSLFFIKLIL